MNTNAANSRNDGARYARPTASERPSRAVQRITSRHRTGASARYRRVRSRHPFGGRAALAWGASCAHATRRDRHARGRRRSGDRHGWRAARAAARPALAVTLVVVLPGLGGAGRDLAEQFVGVAEDERWLLLAPSPNYDPFDANESLLAADLRVDNEVVMLVGEVMAGSSWHLAPLIDLVGFSRGAQSAHRFALRHPERVAALASFSAGTYTMPTSAQPYPLGMGGFDTWNHLRAFDAVSLRRVRVLIGVGTSDVNPADVARAWDGVGGTSRLERAARFAEALEQLQVPARLQTYAGVGH